MSQYDLVVVGTGAAAQAASALVRHSGRSVAVIDHRPFGGTCALRGCDPKKVLVGAADAADIVSRMRGYGVEGDVLLDWKELIDFKRTFTAPVPKLREQALSGQGIHCFHGSARFVAPDTIRVGDRDLKARNILLACGAKPAPLGLKGEEYLMTSDTFMEIDSLPECIIIVGGGYIAAEFSHIAARAGAKVTILQRVDRLLPRFDRELVGWLMDKFYEMGIVVHLETTVTAIGHDSDRFTVHAQRGGDTFAFEADLVIHAAGRVPDIADLDPAAGNVAVERGRLQLNEYLQSTSNPIVYAAGDAAAKGPPLTPVSSYDGKLVAANLIHGNSQSADYRAVPSVAFTLPPIAAVGLSEDEARRHGVNFRVKSALASDWYAARRVRETVYGYKTLVEEGSGRIIGAHLVGPGADDVINVFALAIRHGLTARDMTTTMFAYPTGASDIAYML